MIVVYILAVALALFGAFAFGYAAGIAAAARVIKQSVEGPWDGYAGSE